MSDKSRTPVIVGAARTPIGKFLGALSTLSAPELGGIATRDDAGSLRGASIGVPHEELPALRDGEHYQADLVGLTVVNRAGEVLGSVVDFVASGAHPIVRVKGEHGERLIPWIDQYIDRVDVVARRVDVDWPLDY